MRNNQTYVLDKVVISGGYGNRESEQINRIKLHLETLLSYLEEDSPKKPKVVITNCVKPNAVFKIKLGKPIGIKVTLRKKKAVNLLKILNKIQPLFVSRLKYNNNTMFMGLEDHKKLKLEKYKYNVPEYGINIAMVFNLKERKSLIKKKISKKIDEKSCIEVLQKLIA